MTQLRVGFLSAADYARTDAFSGTLYSMHQALRRSGVRVVDLGWPTGRSLWHRARRKLRPAPSLGGGTPDLIANCQRFAAHVTRQLHRRPVDVVFAPVASEELAQLELDVPIVYASDVTFQLFLEGYGRRYDAEREAYLERAERDAIRRAARLVYSSDWAARSAVEDYGADPAVVRVVSFGANLAAPPDASRIDKRGIEKTCKLLFVGRDFERKGGRIALDAQAALRAAGIEAELTMLGCAPPDGCDQPGVRVIPSLDKNVPDELEQIRRIYHESHFFLLPTRADCSPIVLCEANAYGLPVVTSEVGGIPTIVREGTNGFMLPLSAGGAEYAALLQRWIRAPEAYQGLVKSARAEYDERLNWAAWAKQVRAVLEETRA